MTTPTPLNPLTIPVHGIHLIEASAGTGKTWNIAALFTRLVLLEQQSVEKILVVTFTKAATAELKTRLRARLDQALAALKRTPNAQTQPQTLRQNSLDDKNRPDDFLFNLLNQALANESQERRHLHHPRLLPTHPARFRFLLPSPVHHPTQRRPQRQPQPNRHPRLLAHPNRQRPHPSPACLSIQSNPRKTTASPIPLPSPPLSPISAA